MLASTLSSRKRRPRSPVLKVLVNVSGTRFGIVKKCCEELGYEITKSKSDNALFWCDPGGTVEYTSGLRAWQFYNHFPGTWAIARKVDLSRNISRMARMLPELYDFHPKSFIVPNEILDLQLYMRSTAKKSKRTFIVKPDGGSLGKGIVLVRNPAVLDGWYEPAIAQWYIPPYLIDELKFDLRIYVLVSSIEPLRVYIHDEGLARFCTEKYTKPKARNLSKSFKHLTNYSLNKANPAFSQPVDGETADHGHKRSLASIFAVMKENGIDVEHLKGQIDSIIRLTMISIQPFVASNYRSAIPRNDGKSRCFEVLGFDIMIDRNAKPWLLEVNWAPSLATDSAFDVTVKSSVVKGALEIMDISPRFREIVGQARGRPGTPKHRGPISLYDESQELDISKQTHYRLIYPLDKSDPKWAETERAFHESREVQVGAGVRRPARPKSLDSDSICVLPFLRKVSAPVIRHSRPRPTAPVLLNVEQRAKSRPRVVRKPAVSDDSDRIVLPPEHINVVEEQQRQQRLQKQRATSRLLRIFEKITAALGRLNTIPRPTSPPHEES